MCEVCLRQLLSGESAAFFISWLTASRKLAFWRSLWQKLLGFLCNEKIPQLIYKVYHFSFVSVITDEKFICSLSTLVS